MLKQHVMRQQTQWQNDIKLCSSFVRLFLLCVVVATTLLLLFAFIFTHGLPLFDLCSLFFRPEFCFRFNFLSVDYFVGVVAKALKVQNSSDEFLFSSREFKRFTIRCVTERKNKKTKCICGRSGTSMGNHQKCGKRNKNFTINSRVDEF